MSWKQSTPWQYYLVTYSFNIINCTFQELTKLNTKTRKFLTMYKMHNPKSDVDRLYLPRTEGGRGLIHMELSYKTSTMGLEKKISRRRRTPSSTLSKTITTACRSFESLP